jgi:hypothetical protein
MRVSIALNQLSRSYRAELDDLREDTEGRDVLQKRLQSKRREIGFLCRMIEISPEMVAVVFHRAFTFRHDALMGELVSRELDDLPDWEDLKVPGS